MIIKSGAFFSFKQLCSVYVDDHDDTKWASYFKNVQKSLIFFIFISVFTIYVFLIGDVELMCKGKILLTLKAAVKKESFEL